MKLTDQENQGVAEEKVTVGQAAPDFRLKTSEGGNWRLSDHLGKVITLLFYPKNETLVCTKQMCSLRDHWTDYLKTKAEIVGISPGTIEELKEFGQKYKLPLTLLADDQRNITNRFGYHWLFPTVFMRTIVVIDAEGIIRTRRPMLRAFRPSDRSVLTAIYAARGDALQNEYQNIIKKIRKK